MKVLMYMLEWYDEMGSFEGDKKRLVNFWDRGLQAYLCWSIR